MGAVKYSLVPRTEARAYFENLGYNKLPRQSTADYLTGCSTYYYSLSFKRFP